MKQVWRRRPGLSSQVAVCGQPNVKSIRCWLGSAVDKQCSFSHWLGWAGDTGCGEDVCRWAYSCSPMVCADGGVPMPGGRSMSAEAGVNGVQP